jgi:hypothetical protein
LLLAERRIGERKMFKISAVMGGTGEILYRDYMYICTFIRLEARL